MPQIFQKTLAIITPNLQQQTENILKSSNLAILQRKKIQQLRSHQIHQFLHQANSVDNVDLKKALTTGHFLVLIIGGVDAVSTWLELIGQVDLGQANTISVLYGSGDIEAASRDIGFFFPGTQMVEYRLGSSREYLSRTVKPLLIEGLVSMSKERPQKPLLWLAQWLLENRPHEI